MHSIFANDIFRNEMYYLFTLQTQMKREVKAAADQKIEELLKRTTESSPCSEDIFFLISRLSEHLKKHKGKKLYGYLHKDAKNEDCNMTLGEWLDKWINEFMTFTLRPSCLYGYKMVIKCQIKPFLGKRPLSALTTNEIQKFYNNVKKNGRVHPDKQHGTEISDSMVRKTHLLLHEALDMAVKKGQG